jgi:acyl carrier protein phosphodiesterase
MNWLAHLVLSDRSPSFRIGNLLPDLMTRQELEAVWEAFQRGIECHRRIDVFTDAHPVVRRSARRLSPPHRRFAPILIDIFYDHFLSLHWQRYSPQPIETFVSEIYDAFDASHAELPAATNAILRRMREENWLGSYGEIAGIRLTLERVGRRLRRPVQLGDAAEELEKKHAELETDFDEFFPQLRAHIAAFRVSPDSLSSTPAYL